jgi:hypothetical protein
MAKVGVQRLGARHRQEDGPEHAEAAVPVAGEELEGVPRIDREQDPRRVDDVCEAEQRQREEPEQGDGTKDQAHRGGAPALNRKQQNQDHDRDRHDERVQVGRRNGQTFDGAEHRNRGRDRPIAVEQRRAEHAQHEQDAPVARRPLVVRQRERHQGQNAAFTVVVGAQNVHEVLDGHDRRQRPEHERQNTEDIALRDGYAVDAETLAQRIQRARADVPVDDSERQQ